MPRVRTASLTETEHRVRTEGNSPCAGIALLGIHTREIKSATRSKSAFPASCTSPASKLFKITGTLGMGFSRSSRSCNVFCSAAFSAAGALKRRSEGNWLGAVSHEGTAPPALCSIESGRELLDQLRQGGRDVAGARQEEQSK